MVVKNLPKQEVNKEKKKQTNLSFSDELGRIFGEKCITVADMKKETLKPGQTSRNYVAQIPIKFFKWVVKMYTWMTFVYIHSLCFQTHSLDSKTQQNNM